MAEFNRTDVFEHPDARSEQIPFDTFRDNVRIETPVVFNTTAGGIADTSFTTPADGVLRASDAVGLTLEQKVLATAVDGYYDALLEKGIEPSLGRDINNFELDHGSLRLKGYPDINIVNTRTSASNTLDYVAKQVKGGGGGGRLVGGILSGRNWVSRIGRPEQVNKNCHQPRMKNSP